jgi:glycosyltransferase involved in cell wall biosynthesis
MNQKNSIPRIGLILPCLSGGGAEKLNLALARHWLSSGIEVDLVLMRAVGDLMSEVPERSRIVELGGCRLRQIVWPLKEYLSVSSPDAICVSMWPLTSVAVGSAKLAGFRGRVVLCEHNNMTAQYFERSWFHNVLMRASMAWAYRAADGVVAVSRGVAGDLARLARFPETEINVIYNPATVHGVQSRSSSGTRRSILSVGSFKAQKNHALLLRAFAQVAEQVDAELVILGEGMLRQELEKLVSALGLEGRVAMPGFVNNPGRYFAEADLFVLSSDYEGFGNVIVEALEQGTPVVSTDCPYGPSEILEDGKFGDLVPVGNPDALAVAMIAALSRRHDREALQRRAMDFSVDRAADSYRALLLPSSEK